MARRAAELSTLKNQGVPLLYVDGGDLLFGPFWLKDHPQRDLLREKALLEARALVRMGVGAVNVGRADLADSLRFVEQLGKEPGVPWVATNLRKKGGGYPLPRWRVVKVGSVQFGVFGLLRPEPGKDESLGIEVSDPFAAAREAVKELGAEKVIVCLSNLGLTEERQLAAAIPGITYLIGGGSGELLTSPQSVGETLILHAGEQGKYLGVLEPGGAAAYSHRLVTLDSSVGENAEIADWVAAYKKQEASWRLPDPAPASPSAEPARPKPNGNGRPSGGPPATKEGAKRPIPKGGEIPYVGSGACRNCHAVEHRAWAASGHSRAYASLKGDVQDARCRACHSTVLRGAEGTTVEPAVACEACHGPGGAHRGKGDISRKPTEAACRSCHRGFHEGRKFDWNEAYGRVRCDRKG